MKSFQRLLTILAAAICYDLSEKLAAVGESLIKPVAERDNTPVARCDDPNCPQCNPIEYPHH